MDPETRNYIGESMRLIREIREKAEKALPDQQAIMRMNERLDTLELKINRPPLAPIGGEFAFEKANSFEYKVFDKFLRRGKEELISEEVKVLRVADDPRAGYLAPAEVDTAVTKGISEYSPIRAVASVRQISAESLESPKKTGTGDAYWIGEISERTEVTGFKVGMEKIPANEMAYLMKVSMKQLEDARYSLEQEISEEFSDAFARLEGAAFISGDGVSKPEGIMAHSGVEAINSGVADGLDGDSIMAIVYSIKSGYAPNARFALNRQTLHKIRILKDEQKQYLWMPGLVAGQPNTIAGYPYIECVDMPGIGAGNYPLLFGDFARAYKIVDRVPFSIQRLVEKYAEYGIIGFLGRRRVGGQVILAEAIKKLKCAVSA